MPFYKTVLQFAAYQQQWKEIFYQTQGTPAQAIANVDQNFADQAVSFRAAAVYVAGVSVQDVDQPRSALSKTFTVKANPTVDTQTNRPDLRNACAIVQLESANGDSKRKLFIRGLRDQDTVRDATTGADEPAGMLFNGMNGYIALLATKGFQIRSLMPITPNADPYKFYDIVQITVNASGRCVLTTEAGAVLTPPNQRVILAQFDPKQWPGLNGHYSAKQVALPQFGISYISDNAAEAYTIKRGHYRNEVYRYLTIDPSRGGFVRFGSRNTKSGPFAGRGARRAVRLRFR